MTRGLTRRPMLAFVIAAAAVAIGFGLWRAQPTEAQGPPSFSLPSTAVQVAPGVFSLGTAVHNGVLVEGIAIAHHKDGHDGGPGGDEDPPPPPDGDEDPPPPPDGDPATCFSFIFEDGLAWSTAEPYLFNPALSGAGVALSDLTPAVEAWDSEVASDVFGAGATTGDTLVADTASPDDVNEVYFAAITEPGTIAFTIVWGIVRGPPWARQLIEWDMVFDNDEFHWSLNPGLDPDSDTGEADKMDFLAIAAHEAGHAAGIGHTEDTALCEEQTMFPFASDRDLHQRTLDVGDIAGINELY